MHPVKPETCRAGPVTFDVNFQTGKVELYLKESEIYTFAGTLYGNAASFKEHFKIAREEIMRLICELNFEALRAILKIEEPQTFKIGEDNLPKAITEKLGLHDAWWNSRQINKEHVVDNLKQCRQQHQSICGKREVSRLKELEQKLISELIKNSRRSDRELAKAIGASQPTTTRLRTKLEKEGYIKEYTIIPRFSKIGYHMMAFSFLKIESPVSEKTLEKFKKALPEKLAETPFGIVMAKSCMGGPLDAVIVSLHPDYASFDTFRLSLKHNTLLNVVDLIVFLVNLDEENQFLPLTFSLLANDLLTLKGKNGGK